MSFSYFGNTDPARRRTRFGLRLLPILIGLALIGIVSIVNCRTGPFEQPQDREQPDAHETKLGRQVPGLGSN